MPVARDDVWRNLNDPTLLMQCLPGCDVFERVDDDVFNVEMVVKIGPVKARFKGELSLTDVVEPVSFKMKGAGKGGAAGFVKGEADITLHAETDGVTVMAYSLVITVGGKLAQVGSRLVAGVAQSMSRGFFTRFVRLTSGDETMEVELETPDT